MRVIWKKMRTRWPPALSSRRSASSRASLAESKMRRLMSGIDMLDRGSCCGLERPTMPSRGRPGRTVWSAATAFGSSRSRGDRPKSALLDSWSYIVCCCRAMYDVEVEYDAIGGATARGRAKRAELCDRYDRSHDCSTVSLSG